MHTSFVVFNIIGLAIIVIAAFRIGVKVSKASKREGSEAKNKVNHEES